MSRIPVRCAAILAGGASSRMGREKALLELDGTPLVRRSVLALLPIFPEVAVITSNPEVAAAAGVLSLQDQFPGRSPAAGIHIALSFFERPVFIVACDMPFLEPALLSLMASDFSHEDAFVPCGPDGPEPLHAVYAPAALPVFESAIQQTRPPSLRRILTQLNTRYLEAAQVQALSPNWTCFANWNSPEDVSHTDFGEA